MKTYSVYCDLARKRGAIGKFDLIFRQYFAEDEPAAVAKYREEFETNGPPVVAKEIASPFNADGLEFSANNVEADAQSIRAAVQMLRRRIDRVANTDAADGKAWHDDTDAEDHPLFQDTPENKYPRAIRDEAIIELVREHLRVITENEIAAARREEKEYAKS